MPKPNLINQYLKRKNRFWFELIGSPNVFSIESRIFHSISIGLIVLAIIYVPYNLYAGLYVASLSAFIFILFFSYQYYCSRFCGKTLSANVVHICPTIARHHWPKSISAVPQTVSFTFWLADVLQGQCFIWFGETN